MASHVSVSVLEDTSAGGPFEGPEVSSPAPPALAVSYALRARADLSVYQFARRNCSRSGLHRALRLLESRQGQAGMQD